MKLFVPTGIFHPESGGPATYLYEILPALQARGWQPAVLTYSDATLEADYSYPVTRVPRRVLPLRLLQYAWHAYRQQRDADLVYAHTVDLPLRESETPHVIKIVGDRAWERSIERGWIAPTRDIDAFQTGDDGWWVERVKQSRAAQVRAYDGVIVPSEYLRRMVRGWGVLDERIHVIYNAMPPLPDADFPATRSDARQQLGWDDRPTLFTAARLTPWKGVDHLIAALQQVPDVRLVVAGDGQAMPQLRAQLASTELHDRVQLLGRIPRVDVYRMMKAADYFVLYSGYEGLPHVILEALRMGTPIIASDKGGNPEVVQHGVNGLLAPYIDVDALAATIQRAFTGDTRAQLAVNTDVGMERFTFNCMVTQTDAVLRQFI